MIRIPLHLQPTLFNQQEYGMGYQYGYATLESGKLQLGYFLNGALFATQDELTTLSPSNLAKAEVAASVSKLSIINISLIRRSVESLKGVRRVRTALLTNSKQSMYFALANESFKATQGAEDMPTTATLAGEVFKRFSAYENDFRITDKRALRPGTFATTEEDARNVHTGREAISRYALENKQSANKLFTINPATNTKLKRGTVQPAYGEVGGGVEVIFVDGTTDWTVSKPEILPE